MSMSDEQHQRPVVLKHGDSFDEERRKFGILKMADLLASGGRVVIGTNEPVDEGTTVARDGERHLVIKRRATREDFLDAAPLGRPDDLVAIREIRAAFYYELELWDRVIEGADGERLGVLRPRLAGLPARAQPNGHGISAQRGTLYFTGVSACFRLQWKRRATPMFQHRCCPKHPI
jgi:hypothetical protein